LRLHPTENHPAMKRHLLAALVTFGVCSYGAGTADAGLLRNWRCKHYSTYICVRPYNAFSPVAHGSIHATGCCPITMTPPSFCPPMGMPSCFAAPQLGAPGCCDMGSCGGAPLFQQGPIMMPHPMMPQGPVHMAPMPTPINPSSYWPAPYPYGPYGAVRPVGYQPYGYPYYPSYNPPTNPWMSTFAVPSYWYGGR
jgi:hypothetical protein